MEILKMISNVPSPKRGTSRNAGLDFYSPQAVFLRPSERK